VKNIIVILVVALALFAIVGCDRKTGDLVGVSPLPADYVLDLYSVNEGLHPDQSVLDDPANPFAQANLNMENIWELNDNSPSPKAKFYLWATILANIPVGEYQYFTAKALHELYTAGGSENAKIQAKKAYRATLDHFFDSVTWWKADWMADETYYAVLLRNLVGEALYDPTEMNLLPLYNDPVQALADLSEWGYVYDFNTKTMSRRN
jgi:hypothetical protein